MKLNEIRNLNIIKLFSNTLCNEYEGNKFYQLILKKSVNQTIMDILVRSKDDLKKRNRFKKFTYIVYI